MIGRLFIAIFFIYFVLLSGITTRVLSCDIQKIMRDNPLLNHGILFFSVFIFSYILNWYNFYGLGDVDVVWNSDEKHKKQEGFSNFMNNEKIQYLKKSFLYSILIYVVFILTTKINGKNLAFFMIIGIIILLLQIFMKSYNNVLYLDLEDNHILYVDDKKKSNLKEKYKNEKNIDMFINTYNGMTFTYGILLLFLIGSSYSYYKMQKKDHKKSWSLIKFWLGTNKCKGKFI